MKCPNCGLTYYEDLYRASIRMMPNPKYYYIGYKGGRAGEKHNLITILMNDLRHHRADTMPHRHLEYTR